MLDELRFTALLLNLPGFYFKPNDREAQRCDALARKGTTKLRCGIDAAKKASYYTALTQARGREFLCQK